MDELVLPILTDFSIDKPGYIRKIDKKSHWQPEGCHDLEARAKAASQRVFRPNPDNLYSLWLVENSDQFYGIVTELSAGRTPKNQNLDFLWIDAEELKSAAVGLVQKTETGCLLARDLHFNARIDPNSAKALCLLMMQADRKAQRCKKKQTVLILEVQTKKGCKATETSLEHCNCEEIGVH